MGGKATDEVLSGSTLDGLEPPPFPCFPSLSQRGLSACSPPYDPRFSGFTLLYLILSLPPPELALSILANLMSRDPETKMQVLVRIRCINRCTVKSGEQELISCCQHMHV